MYKLDGLELTNNDLPVELASHHTTRGAQVKAGVSFIFSITEIFVTASESHLG